MPAIAPRSPIAKTSSLQHGNVKPVFGKMQGRGNASQTAANDRDINVIFACEAGIYRPFGKFDRIE
jgi:hypothetical protein